MRPYNDTKKKNQPYDLNRNELVIDQCVCVGYSSLVVEDWKKNCFDLQTNRGGRCRAAAAL